MQTAIQYEATQLTLLDRYVEVEVIEDLPDKWVGSLFGFNVEGTGGSGDLRGCKVTAITAGMIYARGFNQRGNAAWGKVKSLVEDKLAGK